MTEPVDGGGAKESVWEGFAPLGKIQIAGDQGSGALVPFGDEVVEVFVLRGAQGLEPEIVDDEQRHPHKSLESALVGTHGAGGRKAAQQLGL